MKLRVLTILALAAAAIAPSSALSIYDFLDPLRIASGAPVENDRINLGVERAKVLARALRCHPAVLLFPGWDVDSESVARCD